MIAYFSIIKRLFIYLTPFIPLSFQGEGEDIKKRGFAPLRHSGIKLWQYFYKIALMNAEPLSESSPLFMATRFLKLPQFVIIQPTTAISLSSNRFSYMGTAPEFTMI